MTADLSRQLVGEQQGSVSQMRGSIVFWGSPMAFSDWILRVAEAESGAMKVVRVSSLCELAPPDGSPRHVFFDDAVAESVLSDAGPDMRGAGSHWIHAYRDEVLAWRVLARRREQPDMHRIALLPMNLPIDIWTPMFRLVLSGDFVVPGSLLDREPCARSHPKSPVAAQNGKLTPRESEVLRLVARGMRNKTIAHELGLSEHTIKLHLHHVINKIGVRNRTQATQWYLTRQHGEAF